jgi:hypothetical protein
VLRDDHPDHAHERIRPVRRGLVELDTHGVAVELDRLAVLVAAAGRGAHGRIGGVFPIEDDVVGGEWLAVVEGHALLELPDDRAAVCGRLRHFRGEDRDQVAVAIPGGERLVEDAASVLVLGADGEVRVEQRRALPHEQLELAAAATLGGLVAPALLGVGHAGMQQHLAGHGDREARAEHHLDESTPGQLPALHLPDESSDLALVHVASWGLTVMDISMRPRPPL